MCNQIIKIALAQFDNDLNHINRTMSKIEEIVKKASQKKVALCPVKYTDQIDKNFRRLGCGIVPR
ncbi:hypothetical protein, partial [Ligilactobacillus murinus]|uniref:hypothetical protein n=1 Tax=Ligilactobacillus murinus TaxID=1622 RepID=UPI00196300EA